jgi:hypothetical protein
MSPRIRWFDSSPEAGKPNFYSNRSGCWWIVIVVIGFTLFKIVVFLIALIAAR